MRDKKSPIFKQGQIWKYLAFDEKGKKQIFHHYFIMAVTERYVVCYYLNTRIILEEEKHFLETGAIESKEILVCDIP